MPQLDALTYFTQYVYLLIVFSGVYVFVLNFIIPKVASTLKLRQKLVSSSFGGGTKHLTDKLNKTLTLRFDSQNKVQNCEQTQLSEHGSSANLFDQYNHLLAAYWKTNVCIYESKNQQTANWLISTRAVQLSDAMALKKRKCRKLQNLKI